MRRFLLALTASVVVTACGWSLSGYSNGENDKPGGDAGADAANDSATADATSDAGGGTGDEDATLPDGGRKSCADRALSNTFLFCDDFDDPGEKAGAKFTGNPIGSVSGTTVALSAPNGMRSHVDALTTEYGFARVVQPLAVGNGTSIDFRFHMTVEVLGDGQSGYASLAAMEFTSSACKTQGTEHSRRVEVSVTGGTQLYVLLVGLGADCWTGTDDDLTAPVTSVHIAASPASAPKWYDVTLRAASDPCPGQSGSSITVLVDGVVAGCAPSVIDPMKYLKDFRVDLGVENGASWGDITVDYDNVEVTLK